MRYKAIVLTAIVCLGCSKEEADTSALTPKDSATRTESAQKGIESSNMTPEQKQAAADYMRQGAANAQQIEQSARTSK